MQCGEFQEIIRESLDSAETCRRKPTQTFYIGSTQCIRRFDTKPSHRERQWIDLEQQTILQVTNRTSPPITTPLQPQQDWLGQLRRSCYHCIRQSGVGLISFETTSVSYKRRSGVLRLENYLLVMGFLCRVLSEWRSVQVVVFGRPARCWVVRWGTHGGIISPSTLTSTLCLATLDKIIFDLLPRWKNPQSRSCL